VAAAISITLPHGRPQDNPVQQAGREQFQPGGRRAGPDHDLPPAPPRGIQRNLGAAIRLNALSTLNKRK